MPSSSSGLTCTATLIPPSATGKRPAINCCTFNADGAYCMSAGDDRTVRLWNPHRGEQASTPIKEYTAHNQRVLDVCIAADNASFASCGGDRTVFLWDVTSGLVTRRLLGHDQRVNAVRFGPEGGACLMSASYDRTVRCWDLRARSTYPMQVLSGAADSVSALAVGEHEIVAGSIDGTVVTFDLRRGEALRDSLGPPVGHVALSNDQNCLLCSTLDSTLRLLDKASGTVLCEYKGHENSAFKMGCTLSTDDSRVLCGSEKGHLHAWDLVEGRQLLKHQAHSGPLVSLSCHPKQANSLLTASHDGTVKLWTAPGG